MPGHNFREGVFIALLQVVLQQLEIVHVDRFIPAEEKNRHVFFRKTKTAD
jgi:hypothetical protein